MELDFLHFAVVMSAQFILFIAIVHVVGKTLQGLSSTVVPL